MRSIGGRRIQNDAMVDSLEQTPLFLNPDFTPGHLW